ncbi:Histone-lysine N-methyltransferase ASHR1 [Pseudocercospora fuligena]|uniref:Histone-lysine N-methyltransferase ASHR1 n=1 Tax=Pseudocercospora fuligena TaxID=685502 RepID=A0A8H6R9S1_9PEZI|nr:Histone-lysine N-methyltransferase ASHR1 [Pseudocercospora fuligena]
MAADIEVKSSAIDGAGRGLFAKKDFQPGDAVLTLDRPYVAELDIDRLGDTCAWCFQRGAVSPEERKKAAALGLPSGVIDTKACSGCKKVRYCSKTCQARSWKREHKYECNVLKDPNRPDLPHGVRAVIKLLGRLKADPEGKDELLLSILQFKPAADSKSLDFIKQQDPQRFEDFNMLGYGAWKYAGEPEFSNPNSPGVKFSNSGEATAKAFFFNVISNLMQLSNPMDDTKLGIGFDPILNSSNHSCDPNTAVVFNQPKIVLRALRSISKGEEIFMKYIDVSNPFSVRQAELKESYFFSCRCSKCKKGANFDEDKLLKSPTELSPEFAKVADGLIKRHEKQLSKFYLPISDETAQRRAAALQAEAFSVSGITFDFNKGNEEASEDEIKDALKLTLNSGLWSITRQPVPHLLRQLLVCYISQGRAYQAWRVGLKMYFEIAPVLYKSRSFYPDRVVDLWLMTNITNQLCNPNNPHTREIFQESMKSGLDLRVVFTGFLFQTRDNMEKSYGKESPFGRVVESMYAQTMANTDILLKDMKDMVKETWPKLEAVAKSVDILKL